MSNAVATLHASEADYMARFTAKQDQIANDANTGRTKFTEGMAEMCAMQQQEILRLNRIIRDNTVIPERHPVSVSVATTMRPNGTIRDVLFAIANDKSLWMMTNESGSQHHRWNRVPGLPQAADEGDGGQ